MLTQDCFYIRWTSGICSKPCSACNLSIMMSHVQTKAQLAKLIIKEAKYEEESWEPKRFQMATVIVQTRSDIERSKISPRVEYETLTSVVNAMRQPNPG